MKLLEKSSHDSAAATLRALERTQSCSSVEAVRAAVQQVFGDCSPCRRCRVEMFALGRLTPLSMKEIGKAVGKTVSAVSKACKAIGVQLAEDAELARRMRLVARQLQAKASPNSPSASPHDPAVPAQ